MFRLAPPSRLAHSRLASLSRLARTALVATLATSTLALTAAAPAMAQSAPQPAEQKGKAIAVEADKRDTGWVDSRASLKMILGTKDGQQRAVRELDSKALERTPNTDGDKSLIVFRAPKDVQNTALLTYNHVTGNDDQWIYLPALKRVKRIASANRSGPFMGSEFAYEDFAAAEIEKFTYKWLKDEACGQMTCHVIERVPTYGNSGYSRQVVWMDQPELRVQRVDYYDQRGKLLKTLTSSQWKQYEGKFWRAHDMNMVNHQTGKTTRLTWGPFQLKTGLSANDFTETSLARQ